MIGNSSAVCLFQSSIGIIHVPVDYGVSAFFIFAPLITYIPVNGIMISFNISVPVDMHLPAAFFITVKKLAISLLIDDLIYLPHTVVAIGNRSSICIRCAGDIPCIVIGITLRPSFRRVDFGNSPPCIQNKFRYVLLSVDSFGYISPWIINQTLGRNTFLGIILSLVKCGWISG